MVVPVDFLQHQRVPAVCPGEKPVQRCVSHRLDAYFCCTRGAGKAIPGFFRKLRIVIVEVQDFIYFRPLDAFRGLPLSRMGVCILLFLGLPEREYIAGSSPHKNPQF